MPILKYLPDAAVMLFIYVIFLRKRWAKNRPIAHFLFYLSVCAVFVITLSPFFYDLPHVFGGIYTKYNFDPFVDLLNGYGSPLQECIENVALFVPFTFFYRCAFQKPWWKAVLLGMLYSTMIELLQPLLSDVRVCDITDMITNSFGALLGTFLYYIVTLCAGKVHREILWK